MAVNPIFVETEEEIPAVIERIKRSNTSEVPLVLPARSRFGQSRFNFQLLRDYAGRLGKDVSIISTDPAVQRMAEESGFTAYRAVDHYARPPEPEPSAPVAVQVIDEPVRPRVVEPAGPVEQLAPTTEPVGSEPGVAPPTVPIPPVVPATAAAVISPAPAPASGKPQPPIRVVSGDISSRSRTGARRPPRIKVAAPQPLPSRLATEMRPNRLLLYLGAGLVLAVGLVAMVVYVPSAKVRLVADARPFSTEAEVTAEPNKAPIRVRTASVTKEARASQKATGVKIIPGAVAKGTITIDSRACALVIPGRDFAITVPNGTRLRGPGGGQFAINGGNVVMQGATQAQTSIVATQPGAGANVGPGAFSFENADPATACVTAHTDSPMAGGTDEQKKTVVSAGDIDTVRTGLEQQLRKQAGEDLAKQVQPGEKLADNPVVATPEFSADHKVDDEAGSFNASMKLTAEGAFYVVDDVARAFTDVLQKKVPADQQLTGNRPRVDSQVTAATAGGHLTLKGSATGYVAPKIDLNRVRGQLPGQPTSRVRTDLGRLPVRSVDIQQYPVKLPILPLAGSRIDLEYDVTPAAPPKSA